MNSTAIATGLASGERALPELAAVAVKDALASAGSEFAHSILLFLSGHFVQHSQPAISAATRAGRCLSVSGCTVPGLFTEKAVALDQPAAAALVMCGNVSLGLPRESEARICFAQASQIDPAQMEDGIARCGTLASNANGEADGQLWLHGKLTNAQRCEISVRGATMRSAVSRGCRALSPPLEVRDSDNFEVLQLDDDTALDSLLRRLDPDTRKLDALPPGRIFAALPDAGVDAGEALASGRYSLLPILRINRDERSITLAGALPLRARFWWALRDPIVAEEDMRTALGAIAPTGGRQAAFGLLFNCIGRGPYFYGGEDRDLALVHGAFPRLPLLGAYGAGEIAPIGSLDSPGILHSKLLSYSSVVTIATIADVNTRV